MDFSQPLTYAPCTLCPRRCGVDRARGEKGFCGAGAEMQIARAALHPWEEPCLSGEHGSGTIFFTHCTLRCVFCQNHEISGGEAGVSVSPAAFAKTCLRLEKQGAANINLVTPTHYAPSVQEGLRLAKSMGLSLPIVYNCGGYEAIETIKAFEGLVDIWLPDFKYATASLGERYSAAPDYPAVATAAITEMLRQTGSPQFFPDGRLQRGVIVRQLLLPSHLTDALMVIERLWEAFGNQILYSIMSQYTPMPGVEKKFPMLGKRVPPRHYEALVEFAASLGISDCYIQEGDAVGESFIPAFDGTGIVR